MFKSIEQFVFLTTDKTLGNFSYKDELTSKYSIALLRKLVEKIKSKTNNETYAELGLAKHIIGQLMKINESALADPAFYKLRSDLFEVVSLCLQSDYPNEYLPQLRAMIDQVLFTNHNGQDNLNFLVRTLRDIIGLVRPLHKSNVFVIFCKLCYSRILDLFKQYAEQFTSNEQFNLALLDFYDLMCTCSLESMMTNSQTATYTVLLDSFNVLGTLLTDCNNVIQTLPIQKLKEFFTNKHEMLSGFLVIFKHIVNIKNMNFGIFSFFGQNRYTDLLKALIRFIGILNPVLQAYPDQAELVFDTCYSLITNQLEIIATLDIPYTVGALLAAIAAKFQRVCQSGQNDNQDNMLDPDTADLNKIKECLTTLQGFISLELLLEEPALQERAKSFKEAMLTGGHDIPSLVFEASLSMNYPIHVANSFAGMLFSFMSLDSEYQFVIPQIGNFLTRTYVSPTGPEREQALQFINMQLQTMAHWPSQISHISSFQSKFSEMVNELLNKLIKPMKAITVQASQERHGLRLHF